MTRRRSPDFNLDEALRDPGFTPRTDDVPALLDKLGGKDEALSEQAGRALLRAGPPAALAAVERAAAAPVEARRRLTVLIGRAAPESLEARAFLIQALRDPDPKTRAVAASALGKIHTDEVEAALLLALESEQASGARRSIVEALGKVGGIRALEALERLGAESRSSDAPGGSAGADRVEQERSRAALIVARTLKREAPSVFDPTAPAPSPIPVVLRCRRGLEEILRGELDPALRARVVLDNVSGSRVEGTLSGAPDRLLKARTLLSLGFPLPDRRVAGDEDTISALIDALASAEAALILTRWTQGPPRYRIAWARGGKRRAAVWRVAEEVSRRRPEIVNDPTESSWQAVVYEGPKLLRVELVPRFEDARFAYRRGDVPAASHPTIAAALVRVAGVRPDDLVWDPFVGSGLELCERAIAGEYRALIGSDSDVEAIEIARQNLAAAGASRVELYRIDARDRPPFKARPTVILTNPPLGRRVHRSADLGDLLGRFLERAAEVLAPGGRLVWISPFPERTARLLTSLGLEPFYSQLVDMGGFDAQIQGFRKERGKAEETPGERRGGPRRRSGPRSAGGF
ncbi:MAG TPA: HEAT repeat domain-containing protein [Polyangiaceae bacterium]|nr:HEAT repeat domain-containing protein [Polyangiaceae bacterium]